MANSAPVVIASDQSAVPVSGTITANLGTLNGASTSAKQDTGNASLSSIDGKITAVNTGAVVISSSALPSGASTSAKQPALGTAGTASTDVITVQGISGGTNLNVDIKAMSTSVTVQDGGGSVTVDNNGTFATQATIGASATNIAKAEDSASADADVGVPSMAIRKASPANTSSTDGDYEMLQMSAGRLWVDASGKTLTVDGSAVTQPVSASSLPLPTGASTLVEQQTQTTALQLIDDVVATTGSAVPSKANLIAGTDGTNARAFKTDSSGELQIDVLTLPSITATDLDIRDLSASTDAVKVHGDVGVLDQFDLTNSNPAVVAIVDSNGDQITSFGGGTQYTEGDTDASITGTAMLMEGATNTLLPVQGTVADGLLVNLGANNDVTVSGVSTEAKQDTIIGHLDGVEGLLTTIDGDTGNISTKIDTIAGAVSGTEMQVDVVSMPTTTVQDGGGSLTVDAPVGTPVFVRLSDGASAIATLPVSLASVPSHAVTNAGTFAVQVDGSALTALQLIDDTIYTDDSAFMPGTSKVNVAGYMADETSTDSIDEGDVGVARMTLDRKVVVSQYAHTAGGATPYVLISASSTNATSLKASAGQIYSIQVFNTNASARYLKLYNKASAPTVGSDTPVKTILIPGASAGAGASISVNVGISFSTGIAFAITTGIAHSDTGAVGANDIAVNIDYI